MAYQLGKKESECPRFFNAFILAGLLSYGVQSNFPEEIKAVKSFATKQFNTAVQTIASTKMDECTMRALAHAPTIGCEKN